MSGPNQPPRGWHRGGPPSPIQYRPPSPWAPSPPPIISGPRRSLNSPAPGTSSVGMSPRSTPISPMFGSPGQRGTRGPQIPCPRPRWPGPVQPVSPHQNMVSPSPMIGVNGPKPYVRPPFSPPPINNNYSRASPVVCQTPPEYLYSAPAPYEPARYEFVGVPLEPPQPKSYVIYDDDEDHGPSTAEIIANQSQDYVDEKLAEYQMTIMQLQGEYIFIEF